MDADYPVFLRPGKSTLTVEVQDLPLSPGNYFVDVGINRSERTVAYDVVLDYPLFIVANSGQVLYWLERPWGSLHWTKVKWDVLPPAA